MKSKICLALCALSLSALAFAQRPAPAPSDYPMAHDPVAAYCEGKYYVFTTGGGIMQSEDMKVWKNVGTTTKGWDFSFAQKYVPGFRGGYWAPDIIFHNGLWYLYYSCSAFGKNTSVIGVATNKTLNPDSPDYKWVNHGEVVGSIPGRDNWNAIDPNVAIDENGDAWMSFGSFWGGIKLVKLDKTLTKLAEPQEWYGVCYRPEGTYPAYEDKVLKQDPRGKIFDAGEDAVEAPFIFKKGNYWYLFVSYDYCCRGENSTYKVVVGRSEKITGPYIDRKGVSLMEGGGTLVVEGNSRYAGAGHSATVTFGGKDYLFFHGYDMTDASRAHLLTREISWDAEGWPSVKL